MGQVRVKINGRSYPITCEDGEEDHLHQLGNYLDAVVQGLVGKIGSGTGQISDTHLLIMAGLTIADELSDANKKIDDEFRPAFTGGDEEAFADAVDGVAARLEDIAVRLENI